MKNFYLIRIASKSSDKRQSYLDETVLESYRNQVRDAWNADHPEETLV